MNSLLDSIHVLFERYLAEHDLQQVYEQQVHDNSDDYSQHDPRLPPEAPELVAEGIQNCDEAHKFYALWADADVRDMAYYMPSSTRYVVSLARMTLAMPDAPDWALDLAAQAQANPASFQSDAPGSSRESKTALLLDAAEAWLHNPLFWEDVAGEVGQMPLAQRILADGVIREMAKRDDIDFEENHYMIGGSEKAVTAYRLPDQYIDEKGEKTSDRDPSARLNDSPQWHADPSIRAEFWQRFEQAIALGPEEALRRHTPRTEKNMERLIKVLHPEMQEMPEEGVRSLWRTMENKVSLKAPLYDAITTTDLPLLQQVAQSLREKIDGEPRGSSKGAMKRQLYRYSHTMLLDHYFCIGKPREVEEGLFSRKAELFREALADCSRDNLERWREAPDAGALISRHAFGGITGGILFDAARIGRLDEVFNTLIEHQVPARDLAALYQLLPTEAKRINCEAYLAMVSLKVSEKGRVVSPSPMAEKLRAALVTPDPVFPEPSPREQRPHGKALSVSPDLQENFAAHFTQEADAPPSFAARLANGRDNGQSY